MLSIAFSSSFRDFKGTNHFSLRGFSTLDAGSGEGFGRAFIHEDIKKEKRTATIHHLPKSIDEIVLPFFMAKGKGLEKAVSYVANPLTAKSTLPIAGQSYADVLVATPFTPSFAFDVKTAMLSYVRSEGDYSLGKLGEYTSAPYEPVETTLTLSRYSAQGVSPQVLVPPKVAEKATYHAETKIPSYVAAPLIPSVLHAPTLNIERTVAYQRVINPIGSVNVALNLPQPKVIMPYQTPITAPSRKVPAMQVRHFVQKQYIPVKTERRENYLGSILSKYVSPLITALGLSMAPAITFSGEYSTVQKESVPMIQRHDDISSVVEPQRNTLSAEPRIVEKLKRELPRYEKIAVPAQLEQVAKEMETKYGGEMSFRLINMKEGYSFGRKDDMVIPPASLSKLGLVYAARILAERGDLSLEQKISVKDFMEKHPQALPRNIGDIKEEYTLRDILEVVVRDWKGNSNLFSNMLLDMMGKDTVHAILKENGFNKTRYKDNPWREHGEYHLNTTSLQEIGTLMQALLDPKQWSSQYTGVFEKILHAHEAWAPLLLGPMNGQKGMAPTIYLKQGGTENAMSLVSYIVEPNGAAYLLMGSMTNTKENIVKEDMRKATPTGVQLVNDFIYFARSMYAQRQSSATFNYK